MTERIDPENQVLLGGDNGLRGYPLRYQAGERRAILNVEQRFFTDWYPWRLFRVGYAVFVDVGRVSGRDPRAQPKSRHPVRRRHGTSAQFAAIERTQCRAHRPRVSAEPDADDRQIAAGRRNPQLVLGERVAVDVVRAR